MTGDPDGMKIFIIGVNGFIGSALASQALSRSSWHVVGIDMEHDRLDQDILSHPRFEFFHGDLTINREWVEFQIKRADVVIPLAAVAIPKVYVDNPLLVFELDFMENLRIVELTAKHGKRLIFPSSSEVYGKSLDSEFDEESTDLVLGPINKHRWIYGCAKQLLDRVIHAHGLQRGLRYTIFRPFNWVGPGLDRVNDQKIGSSRVVTEFIGDLAYNRPIPLVDGGEQRRTFLYIDDGIDALMAILASDRVDGEILNVGNPSNELSIRELAHRLVELYGESDRATRRPFTAGIYDVPSVDFYGRGYQDVESRRPSIRKAKELLGWEPKYSIDDTLRLTLSWFLSKNAQAGERS